MIKKKKNTLLILLAVLVGGVVLLKTPLKRIFWNEKSYLEVNPDVAAAVYGGGFNGSAYNHWIEYGRFEPARLLGGANKLFEMDRTSRPS